MKGKIAIVAAIILTIVSVHAEDFYFEEAQQPRFDNEIMLDAGLSNYKAGESWFRMNGDLQVRNVEQATLVAFLPPRHLATGEAMIVAPGGGFLGLAIEAEGYDVAEALAERGIAAFVLKYRVLETPAVLEEFANEMRAGRSGRPSSLKPPKDTPSQSLADGRAAINYVRANAERWNIDANRVGMMGFSAGAFLTLSVVVEAPPAEKPAFAAPIYPRMSAVKPPKNAPPLFVAIAADDFLMAGNDLGLIRSWLDAKAPVEFHLFQAGSHGFGLGRPGTTTEGWIDSLVAWIRFNRQQTEQGAR